MYIRLSLMNIIAVCSFALVDSGQVNPYAIEYVEQFEASGRAPGSLFASGYFPESFGQPSDNCIVRGRRLPLVGRVEREWYPMQWMAAGEPSLYQFTTHDHRPEFVLRFSYIPSFSHPIFIRVHKDGNRFRLIAKEMSGTGGHEPGMIAQSKEILLTSDQAAELQRMLDEERLFAEAPDLCEQGLDGSAWLFEKVDGHGYTFVKRRSPNAGAGYNLGKHLLELSGWSI